MMIKCVQLSDSNSSKSGKGKRERQKEGKQDYFVIHSLRERDIKKKRGVSRRRTS